MHVFYEVVIFCLSAEMNSGQDNSHSKCTLWTICLRQTKPSIPPPPPQIHRPFSPLFLHIKNAVLLSLAAHAAKPTRL